MKKFIIFIGVMILLISCNTEVDEISYSEERLLQMAYSDTMIWDKSFYLDNGPESVYYINTVCTTPAEQNVGQLPWRELTASSYVEAKELADSTMAIGGNTSFEFLQERQTEKYYDFYTEENRAFRVHNINYFEPTIDKLNVTNNEMGIYHSIMSENKAKELSEYLFRRGGLKDGWFSPHFHKVLNSKIESNSQYYLCTITSLSLAYGDWDMRDQITVYENYIKVFKNKGLVLYDKDTVRVLYGTQR